VSGSLFHGLIAAALAGGLCAGAALEASADPRPGRLEIVSTNTIERTTPFLDDEDINALLDRNFELETGFHSNTWLRWVQPVGNGAVWRYENQVRFRKFFDRDDLDGIQLRPRIQYWKRFSPAWQIRLIGDFTWFHRDGDTRYTRPGLEAQARYRIDKSWQTVFRTRVHWYDYNEDRLRGFDQTQYRFGVEQYWYPHEDRSYIRGRVFYDIADADSDRQSFDEWRLGLKGLWAVSDKTDLYAEAEYRWREYDGAFSTALPVRGDEERPFFEVGFEHHLMEGLSAVGSIGYTENDSNIPVREYDGLIFSLGVRFRF